MNDDDNDNDSSNIRLKKILLIGACCVSFCVLVGMATMYNSVSKNNKQQEQQQSNAVAFATESESLELNNNNSNNINNMDMDNNVGNGVASTIGSPTIPTDEEEQEQEQDEDVSMNLIPEEEEEDNIFVHDNNNILPPPPPVVVAQQETDTIEDIIDPPNVITEPIDTSSSSIGTDTETIDATIDGILSTIDTNNQGSSNEMTTSTAVPTMYSSGDGTERTTSDGDECAITQIVASSHCENGVASTSIFLCLGTETPLSDQFWAWSDVSPAYELYQERDWGWLAEEFAQFQAQNNYGGQQYASASPRTMNREVKGLPNGRYVLGLYSNGVEVRDTYPLLASSEFVISCGGN